MQERNEMKRITMTLIIAAVFSISARGQGFLNLNFESAQNLPANPGNGVLVSVTNALPDWASDFSYIYYVSNSLGNVSGQVELEGGSLALSGEFSVGLYQNSSISQTGLVPVDAESLEFEAQGPGPGYSFGASGLSVQLGGQSLSYSVLSEGSDYIVYGASIPSNMDGQTEALAFVCQGPGSGDVLLDNIEFFTPEPSEWAMIGLGVVLFGAWQWRRQERFS
jgi:hypothetical protein